MPDIKLSLPVDAADDLAGILGMPLPTTEDQNAALLAKAGASDVLVPPPQPGSVFPMVGPPVNLAMSAATGAMPEPALPLRGNGPMPPAAPDVSAPGPLGSIPNTTPAPVKPRMGAKDVLGKIGGYALSATMPGLAAAIPSTPLGKIAAQRREMETQAAESERELKAAQKDETEARAEALRKPPAKQTERVTPQEQAFQDLVSKGTAPLDAFRQVTQAGEKPTADKALEKVTVVGPDGKPHVYGVDAQGNKKVDYGVEFQKPTDTTSKDASRADRSYQFNSTQLEKERQPLEALMGKISAATTNVDLKSPQADALLAPQILSLSAGGTGSGLRMNEAEISRILGGRTAWESLKAAINKYSTDPNHPQIPEAQRAQMVQILQAAQAKGVMKQQVLEWAEGALVDADDPKQHRQIVQQARQFLDAVDDGKRIQRNKKTGELRIAPDNAK